MRSLSSLVYSALFPSTRVYHDANGNYRGSSTDITPWLVLLGRSWGILVWLYIILLPLLAPVYYIFANWYCYKYDSEFTEAAPKGWPKEKSQILRNHRNILLGWIIFMVWGYCVDWGQNDLPYEYTQPSTHWEESKWEPNPDGSFDEYYKSISEDNPK